MELKERMKVFEKHLDRKVIPTLPIVLRLDGRKFSRFTKDMDRPFDDGFAKVMRACTVEMVKETGAILGYTQSDEISLILYSDDIESEIYFGGRIFKMLSVAASSLTYFFTKRIQQLDHTIDHRYLGIGKKRINFDCKVFQFPSKVEAANDILDRENDATRNSVQMAVRSVYSHNEVLGKSRAEMMDMLMAKGINWNNYDTHYKRGTYFRSVKKYGRFTKEDLKGLPEKHEAHQNPDMEFERSVLEKIEIPPLGHIKNKVEVLFEGMEPR